MGQTAFYYACLEPAEEAQAASLYTATITYTPWVVQDESSHSLSVTMENSYHCPTAPKLFHVSILVPSESLENSNIFISSADIYHS